MKKHLSLFFAISMGSSIGAVVTSIFIFTLNFAIQFFQEHWNLLIWVLPISGLGLSWFINIKYFKNCEVDHSPRLASFTFLTACWSHLFGASVGRESAAVQIGAATTEGFRRFAKLEDHDRDHFMTAGTAAAFSAAMGLPISAIIFAMEYRKKRDLLTLGYSILAAALGFAISHKMQTPHWAPTANSINSLPIDFHNLNWIGLGLFIFAIFIFTALLELSHLKIEKKLKFQKRWLILLISGSLISIATLSLGTAKFNNLGTNIIDLSFAGEIQISDLFNKIFFTETSLLGFWKGGAFTPLMSIGAATGSLLATFFMLSSAQTSAALGSAISCFSLVNLRFKLPITSIILTSELFGWRMGLLSAPLHLGLSHIRMFLP